MSWKIPKCSIKVWGNCRVGDYSLWVSQATLAITRNTILNVVTWITAPFQSLNRLSPTAKGNFTLQRTCEDWLHCLIGFISVGDCLLDQPQRQLSLSDNLPGSSYNLHRQCELAFGPGSKPCPYMQPCSKLWCTGKARGQLVCQTRHFPWADGTSCGNSKVCYRGECNDKNSTIHVKVTAKQSTAYHSYKLRYYSACFSFVSGGWAVGEVECIWRLFTELWWRGSAGQERVWQPCPWEWRQILLRASHQISLV